MRNIKIRVSFNSDWFRDLSILKRREVLTRYLTPEALDILVKQKMEEKDVPQTNDMIDSTGLCFLLIANDLFQYHEKKAISCVICGHLYKLEKKTSEFKIGVNLCSNNCYERYQFREKSILNKKTGVKLQKPNRIHKVWSNIEPFHQEIPSEISFDNGKENQDHEGSFNWTIAIPDLLDRYYWPLIKKEMTAINLNFQPIEFNNANSAA